MLGRRLGLGAIVIGSAAALLAASACGGSSTQNAAGSSGTAGTGGNEAGSTGGASGAGQGGSTGTSTGAKCSDSGVTCALPPSNPGSPPADGTTSFVLAVSQMYLGDTDRSGNQSPDAWKNFGYNLDNLVSSPTDANHCALQKNANPAQVKQDGPGGLDNSFGENLVPYIGQLTGGNLSQTVNDTINKGTFTIMVKFDNLGSAATETGVHAALYGGGNLGSPPKWDGTDQWPITPDLLDSSGNPTVQFSNSYITNNTWVSGSNATVDLALTVQGQALDIKITDAVITMDISADRKSATNGIIAGVINTQNLLDEVQKVAGNFLPSLCQSSAFQTIADSVRAFSDIMSDGTNGDPSKTCDAISIGLGFDAKLVQLGPVAQTGPAPPNPCDGGA